MKNSLANDPAVEMDERFAVFAGPAGDSSARLLFILSDSVIADRVEKLLIGGNRLTRFGCGKTPDFFTT